MTERHDIADVFEGLALLFESPETRKRREQRVHVERRGGDLARLWFKYPEVDDGRCKCGLSDTWIVLDNDEHGWFLLACEGCRSRRSADLGWM